MPECFSLDVEATPTMHPEVQLRPRAALVRSAKVEAAARLAMLRLDDAGGGDPGAAAGAADDEAEAPPPSFDPSALPKARGVYEEGRVYWYVAGTSALASLGVRVIGFFPGLFASALVLSGGLAALGPAASVAVLVAVGLLFVVVDAGAASLASSLVFDSMSNFYESRYLSSFGGHLLGSAIGLGAGALMFGFGTMLLSGVTSLGAFVTADVPGFVAVFSFFGLLPAIPIGFFASVAVPALLGAWATAAGAAPAEGLVIDPKWAPGDTEWSHLLEPPTSSRRVDVFPLALRIGG